jgi:hypothetical protein
MGFERESMSPMAAELPAKGVHAGMSSWKYEDRFDIL